MAALTSSSPAAGGAPAPGGRTVVSEQHRKCREDKGGKRVLELGKGKDKGGKREEGANEKGKGKSSSKYFVGKDTDKCGKSSPLENERKIGDP